MSLFLKYLASLLAHLAWQRIGGRGGVPPVRLPRGRKTVHLPVIAPWQMMIAMWLVKKLWNRHGQNVKSRIMDTNHPLARRVGTLLPDAPDVAPAASPAAPAQSTLSPSQASAPVTQSTLSAAPPPPDYGTKKLDDAPDASVLSGLRGTSPATG